MSKLNLNQLLSLCRDRRKNDFYFFRTHEYVPYKKDILEKEFIRMEPWEVRYIFNVCKTSKIGIIETGRWFGGSTLVLASASNSSVHSFDIGPKDDEKLKKIIQKYSYDNINLYVDDSQRTRLKEDIKYDILFIDGDHSYEGCYNDLNNWFPNLKKGGHVILHDSYQRYNIDEAITDYTLDKNVRFFLSPFNIGSYTSPYGSLCHFQKLDD